MTQRSITITEIWKVPIRNISIPRFNNVHILQIDDRLIEMTTENGQPMFQLERARLITSFDGESMDDATRVNCETTTLVWYDVETVETTSPFENDVKQTKAMLRELNDFVQLFSSESSCIQYMENTRNETIILVISGSGASVNLLQKAHTLRHVDTILIFCMDILQYTPLLDPSVKYTKIAGIFNEQETLKKNILKTVRAIGKQTAIFAIYDSKKQKTNRNLNRESGSFVWLQLVKAAIERMAANLQNEEELLIAKHEFLTKCRAYYRTNASEMKNINEFEETYNPKDAIYWYTRDSFVYKLINKALRTEDVQALYTYRYYIVDLCMRLAENLDAIRDEYLTTAVVKLYRGMIQSPEEVQRLQASVGQLISINAFFSATRNREVAEAYAGVGSRKLASDDLESVIFEINVTVQGNNTRFADISPYSSFQDEQEVLFDFSTVFEIQSMTFDSTILSWICSVSTTDKGNTIAKEYIESQVDQMSSENVVILLGTILFDMGEFRKSKDYYESLQRRLVSNDAGILFGLGRAHCGLSEFREGLTFFNEARRVCWNGDQPDLVQAAKIATYTGNAHRSLCEYSKALTCYNEALNLYEKTGMLETLYMAKTLTGLGWLYCYLGKGTDMLQCFERALDIVGKVVPFEDHPDFSDAHMNVAQALYQQGEYDRAMHHMEKCVGIERRILPNTSFQFAIGLLNMSKFLYKQRNYDRALTINYEAMGILELHREDKDPIQYAFACNNFGKIHYRMGNYQMAKEYYDKALVCLKVLMPNGHIDVAYTLKNMSELHLVLGELETAATHIYTTRKCENVNMDVRFYSDYFQNCSS